MLFSSFQPHLRRHPAWRGGRNWWGDKSLGDILINDNGPFQSFDGGVTYTPIEGWTLNESHPYNQTYDPTLFMTNHIFIPSVEDGDMVVINCRNLVINGDVTLTTRYRCRGLIIYAYGKISIIKGSISMGGRGAHANPSDISNVAQTPTPPSDGHTVPSEGIVIRRLAKDATGEYVNTHLTTDLFYGCGNAAVLSEVNQAVVKNNGYVVKIPIVGGDGAPQHSAGAQENGYSGYSKVNGTGGGGGGGARFATTPASMPGSCFSGGSATAVSDHSSCSSPEPYGGRGGYFGVGDWGGGNPGGVDGTGGVLLIFGRKGIDISASGICTVQGPNNHPLEGNPGGGVLGLWYGDTFNNAVSDNSNLIIRGGYSLNTAGYDYHGGPGGAGSLIGPFKIDQ